MWSLDSITQKEVQEINSILKEVELMNQLIIEECSKISEKYNKIADAIQNFGTFIGKTTENIAKNFGAKNTTATTIGFIGALATFGLAKLIENIGQTIAEEKYRKEMERLQKLRYEIALSKIYTVMIFIEKLKNVIEKLKKACKTEAKKELKNYNNLETVTKQYLEIFYLLSRCIYARQFLIYTEKEFTAWLAGYEGMENNFEPDVMIHHLRITQLHIKWSEVHKVLHNDKPLNIGTIACFYDYYLNEAAVFLDNNLLDRHINLHPNDEIKNRFLKDYVYTNPYYHYWTKVFKRKKYAFLVFMAIILVNLGFLGIIIFESLESWFWRIVFVGAHIGAFVWLWKKLKPNPNKFYEKNNIFEDYYQKLSKYNEYYTMNDEEVE